MSVELSAADMVETVEPTRIVSLETWRPSIQPNLLFVTLVTEDGLCGVGEAFYGAVAVETYLHDAIAPILLGATRITPEWAAQLMTPYAGYQGGGVELRAAGAIDLALWDLLGKRAALPVVDMLGGPVRDEIKIYNTCAGPSYISDSSRQESSNWGRGSDRPHEDLDAFLTRPGELATELLAEGVRGMKVWPFDQAAERTGGADISAADLAAGVSIVRQIREAVGDQMDLMIELHGLWSRRGATRICDALEPFEPFWVEDPIRSDAVDALAALKADVGVPLAYGETCVGRRGFLPLLQRGAVDVATIDVGWTGGLTEARKIASMADAFAIPIAPHDCTGPVALAACTHLVLSQPNGLVQETVRAFMRTWYTECVVGLPEISDGRIRLGGAPGLGVELQENFKSDPASIRRITTLR
jgi:galactonate dehydratase